MKKLENVTVRKTPLFEFDVPIAHPYRKRAVEFESVAKHSR